MVEVTFERAGKALIMDVNGHANFDVQGKDLVCAGASTLGMTVAQCAKFMGDSGKLRKRPNIQIENGKLRVVIKPKDVFYPEAMHLMHVGQTGMRLLAADYPQYLQVKTFETEFDGEPEEPDSIDKDSSTYGQTKDSPT